MRVITNTVQLEQFYLQILALLLTAFVIRQLMETQHTPYVHISHCRAKPLITAQHSGWVA